MNSLGECIPCNYDCLAYFVEFIKAATTPEFILTFTHTNVIMEM